MRDAVRSSQSCSVPLAHPVQPRHSCLQVTCSREHLTAGSVLAVLVSFTLGEEEIEHWGLAAAKSLQ